MKSLFAASLTIALAAVLSTSVLAADLPGACCLPETAALSEAEKSALDGRVLSGFIRAVKPGGADR